jgi:HPt (histidine-containing phosphotransfer) domain-containing protein
MWHKQQSALSTDFDWQQLRQLAGGDTEFEVELLKIFLVDAEGSLRQLEQAIASKSIETIEDIAHSLRGASANVGAKSLADAAFQLEQTARSGKITNARTLLQQMNVHCQSIQSHVQS